MQSRFRSHRLTGVLVLLVVALVIPMVAMSQAPANQYFDRTWQRTDQPVASGSISRTWIWGPSGFTADCMEPYYRAPDGQREVQYFDKSRMEITDPLADRDSDWYVTQGLLATEMITGNMQVGDHEHIYWGPADVHIAGDAGGGSPSYAAFGPLMDAPPLNPGQAITQTLATDGTPGNNPDLSGYGVTAEHMVDATQHRVASVFWDFMNSQGPVVENGVSTDGNLFSTPFYAVGYPITEAYWTRVIVGGVENPEPQDVLVQAFQRRVLTYTPGNDDGWQVEAGNVGQHYYMWRYGDIPRDSANACPNTSFVTFNVYEPAGDNTWERVAITTTREVWHPGGVATGTWAAYIEEDGEILVRNSSGILSADHEYTTISGQQILSSMTANVTQVDGPTGGTAQVQAGGFALGSDPRVNNSFFTGSGSMSFDTGTETGTVNFEVAGTGLSTFHVFLDQEAPPVFFQ